MYKGQCRAPLLSSFSIKQQQHITPFIIYVISFSVFPYLSVWTALLTNPFIPLSLSRSPAKMKTSTISVNLSFAASTHHGPYAKPANILGRHSDPLSGCAGDPTCIIVVQALEGWATSVNTVNTFLNTGTNPQTAITAVNLEPDFLGTLSITQGLGSNGVQAA
jgi:hypothetical protein